MYTYKLKNTKELDGTIKPIAVLRSDGWGIPLVEENSMYQEYLKWVKEGNIPEPADPIE